MFEFEHGRILRRRARCVYSPKIPGRNGSKSLASGTPQRSNYEDVRAVEFVGPVSSPQLNARMPLSPTLMVAAVATAAVAIVGFMIWWMLRSPRVHRDRSAPLPLFGSMPERLGQASAEAGVMAGGTVRPQARATPAPTVPAAPRAPSVSSASTAASTPPAAVPSVEQRPGLRLEANPTVRTFTTSSARAVGVPKPLSASAHSSSAQSTPQPTPVTPESSPVIGHGVPGRMVEGHLVRFSVPQEGTLQFLPGRLEIGAGLDAGREIRFVHVPGPNGTEVTFGRSEGELYRHIQLRDQTVSRSHARMRFADGHWYLLNLSQTNPIVHNSTVVANSNEHVLSDGDRIEMGEVLFTFRSR